MKELPFSPILIKQTIKTSHFANLKQIKTDYAEPSYQPTRNKRQDCMFNFLLIEQLSS